MATATKSPVKKTIKRTAKPRAKAPVTYVANLLDVSGSTAYIREELKGALNAISSEFNTPDYLLSLYLFNSECRAEYVNCPGDRVKPLVYTSPIGGTGLFDALRTAMNMLEATGSATNKDTNAYLVNIFTDGVENCSKEIDHTVNRMLALIDTDRWTFTFQVPRGTGDKFSRLWGVPRGNVSEWNPDKEGTQAMAKQTVAAVSSYKVNREKGVKATKSFYTDVDKVNVSDLEVVSDEYRILSVSAEARIDDFVTSKVGSYKAGDAFYELTKVENVQNYKDMLIRSKKSKVVYGDGGKPWQTIRGMLGLSETGDVRVHPGNHGDYGIYVQSTSANRKLVRGTKVLVRK